MNLETNSVASLCALFSTLHKLGDVDQPFKFERNGATMLSFAAHGTAVVQWLGQISIYQCTQPYKVCLDIETLAQLLANTKTCKIARLELSGQYPVTIDLKLRSDARDRAYTVNLLEDDGSVNRMPLLNPEWQYPDSVSVQSIEFKKTITDFNGPPLSATSVRISYTPNTLLLLECNSTAVKNAQEHYRPNAVVKFESTVSSPAKFPRQAYPLRLLLHLTKISKAAPILRIYPAVNEGTPLRIDGELTGLGVFRMYLTPRIDEFDE